MKRLLILMAAAVALSGCASVFNPYNSKFQCPPTDPGKCVSLKTAYQESLAAPKDEVPSTTVNGTTALPENLYLKEKYRTLAELIKEPKPPIVKPPKVMRVLILSYVGDSNVLYGWRYVYFFADEPSWTLDVAGGVEE